MSDATTTLGPILQGVGDRLSGLVLGGRRPKGWLPAFLVACVLSVVFAVAVSSVIGIGVGLFGMNIPVAWTFPIVLTIWWVGIAHAGTLISAVLLLTRQRWRTPITRMAEAMSMFAIVVAGMFPILHLGRPWLFYYLLPYPSTTTLWPQWSSPLVWDIFAITTYLVFTFCFLYLSLLPDMATLRDRSTSKTGQYFYGILALGWRGRAVEWRRYEQGYFALAFLAAPIVILVTGIISLDLSVSIVPGYHFTIFPPYFICGALFSGFATVIVIAVAVRWMYGLHDLITPDHIERLAKLMLGFGLIVNYAYIMEMFTAFYSGLEQYRYVYIDRWTGPYAPFWWSMIFCNVVVLQLVWFRRIRRSLPAMLCIGILVDVGMWLERYQIVLTSTHADYMPSAWDVAWPTVFDFAVLFGSIGLFLFMLLLFMRLVPIVSLKEQREALVESATTHG